MKKKLVIFLTGMLFLTGCAKDEAQDVSGGGELSAENDTQSIEEQSTEEQDTGKVQETTEEQSTQAEADAADEQEWENALAKKAFVDVIAEYRFQDWERLGIGELTDETNRNDTGNPTYGLVDVDGDGIDELVVDYDLGYMASMREDIFDYDVETRQITHLDNLFFPSTTFYDNGLLLEDISHNQGMAGDAVWPHTVWKYDDTARCYIEVAYVDGWDKAMGEVDYSGNEFPADVDEDGDGYIYYVTENGETRTLDNAAYEEWCRNLIGDANEISYEKIGFNFCEQLCDDYEKLFLERTEELEADGNLDLGRTYAKTVIFPEDSYLNDYCNAISSVVTLETEDENYEFYTGTVNGEVCIDYMDMDGGSTTYHTAVDGVTLMGIKPGDTLEDAVQKLEQYVFYEQSTGSGCYINGFSYDGIGVRIESENGMVTQVSISFYSYYWG